MFLEPSLRQTITVDDRAVGVLPAANSSPLGALPIILLHGLGCSADAWRPTLGVLAERCIGSVYVPNGQFRRLSGAARAMQFTQPREFTEIALSFWAGRVEDNGA